MIKLLNKKDFNFEVRRNKLLTPSKKDTGYDTIWKEETGESMGVVSREYKLITHQRAIDSVLEQFDKQDIEVENVKNEITRNGARGFFTFNIPSESYDLEPRVNDLISPGFIISNSYDRGLRFGLQSFIYRLVCKNGLMAKDEVYTDKKRHINSLQEDQMTKKFIQAIEKMKEKHFPELEKFTQRIIKTNDFQKEINLLPGWLQKESLDQLEEKELIEVTEEGKERNVEIVEEFTIWEFLNTLTYSLTHSDKSTPENKLLLGKQISNRLL